MVEMFFGYFVEFYINRAFGVSYIVTNVLYCVAIPFALSVPEASRKYAIRRSIEVPCVWAVQVLLCCCFYCVFGMAGMAYMMYAVFPVLIAAYAAALSRLRPMIRLVNAFVFNTTVVVSVRFSEAIGIIIREITGKDLYGVGIAVVTLMVAATVTVLNVSGLRREERIHPVSAVVIGAVSALATVAQLFAIDTPFALFIEPGLWAVELLVYYMTYMIVRSYNRNLLLVAERQDLENQKNLIMISERNLQKVREIRHDIKNQLGTVKALMDAGDYAGAGRFFDELYDGLFSGLNALTAVDCGNRTVNAVVNMELKKAEAHDVRLETKIAVPHELPYSENDLCSLLTNLLDNAIEAAAASGEKTPVTFDMKARENYLFVRVRNPVDASRTQEDILSLRTTKDPDLHGCGTKIIAKMADKYNGAVKYGVTSGIFVADVMLRLDLAGGRA